MPKPITKTETINALAKKTGISKREAKELITLLADLAASEVRKKGEFILPGFGKLVSVHRKAREGRNPATGAPIKIPAKTIVKFRPGKAMSGLHGDPVTETDD